MSPPSATEPSNDAKPTDYATHEPGISPAAARGKMDNFPRPPKFDDSYKERAYLKGRLAAAFRIFGKYGFDEGVAGHITLRDPVDPTTFWVNPFGVSFSLIKASDLILVNEEGQVIDGGPCRLLNLAAYMIHSAVHQARPEVNAAAHSHSLYGRTFCALGKPLDVTTQDACAFYNVSSEGFLVLLQRCLQSRRITSFMTASTASCSRRKKARTSPKPLETTRRLCCRTTAF
jgi:hypothetical protein